MNEMKEKPSSVIERNSSAMLLTMENLRDKSDAEIFRKLRSEYSLEGAIKGLHELRGMFHLMTFLKGKYIPTDIMWFLVSKTILGLSPSFACRVFREHFTMTQDEVNKIYRKALTTE
jgi:hypothetical protein